MSSSNWYTDWQQNERLDELRDELQSAASETSHLRSRLAQVQGSLEARVNKLASAFDAFVELSDVRQELIGFADAAEVRRHAGQMLAAIASDEAVPAAPADVVGYWLHPAVAAVQAQCAGADPVTLAEATARDERRTAMFLCLALAALGRRGLARAEWLQLAFGATAADGTVNRIQRTLWMTAARGGFGETGSETVAALLRPAVRADGEAAASWTNALAVPRQSRKVPVADDRVVRQTAAADQLARLRTAVEAIVADRSVLEPAGSTLRSGDALDPGTPAAKAEVEAEAEGKAKADAAKPEPADPLVDMLRVVIAEGSVPERGMLGRVAALRAELSGEKAAAEQSVEQPAGAVDEVLAADLKGDGGPHLAAFAVTLGAPAVLAGAERLRERAAAEGPDEITVLESGQKIQVRADGPDGASLSEAEHNLRTANQPRPGSGWRGGIIVAAIGLVGGAGLAVVHWFWLLVGVAVAAFGARAALLDRSRRATEQTVLADQVGGLRTSAEAAAMQLAAYAEDQPARTEAATKDFEAIRAALPAQ